MAENDISALHKVQKYRKLVLVYEALDEEIDKLIMANGGFTENMSSEALQKYRELARKRDDVENEMRTLEQELEIDDTDATIM
jgi:hypothetical protein